MCRTQVVNGLMERDDWQVAIKTPIGALPGGSANALASALAHIGWYEMFTSLRVILNVPLSPGCIIW